MLILVKSFGRCLFANSDFPAENPRTQTRNFPYTNTLAKILKKMKQILILFFLSFLYNSFGQTKEIYLNDDLKNISESEFNETTKDFTYNLKFDLDTLIVNVKVLSVKKGEISKQKLDSIKANLSESSKKEINESDIIVINYFPGLDRCNSGAGSSFLREKYSRYLRKINKNEDVSQFFVYKTIE